jgi:hypothetical protein
MQLFLILPKINRIVSLSFRIFSRASEIDSIASLLLKKLKKLRTKLNVMKTQPPYYRNVGN